MKHFLPILLYIIALSVFAPAALSGSGPPAHVLADMEKYRAGDDFKAFALSAPKNGESWVTGYALGYDTPQNAVRAALLYCQKALAESGMGHRSCEPFMAGSHRIGDEGDVETILNEYGEEVISELRLRLKKGHDAKAWTKLETVYQKMGRYEESEAMLAEPAKAGNHEAQNALAYHLAERNVRLELALEMAGKATGQQPGNPSYWDTQAMCHFRLNDLEEAERLERKALALKPKGRFVPVINEHLGDILWLKGENGEAREAWRRALAASSNILISKRLERKLAKGLEGDPTFE